jgi:hypothetical protein
MAALLASEHGAFRTAEVLRFDYSKLKARTTAVGVPAGPHDDAAERRLGMPALP